MAEQRDNALLVRSIPFSDSSLILHLFTESHGRISLMARGARRAKSPFRASLTPLHQLQIRWKEPRTGTMGTLFEVQRFANLLPEEKILAGQELLATASKLFHEGDAHGYAELTLAFKVLSVRPEASGICAATWKMLEASGWAGGLEHCWHCVEPVDLNQNMFWRQGHLLCETCASNQGIKFSSGLRKSISGHLTESYTKLTPEYISTWNMMIMDTIKQHQHHD